MGTNDKMYSRVDLITYKYFCLLYVRGSVKWGRVFHQYNRDGRECVAEDVPFMTNVQHICIMDKDLPWLCCGRVAWLVNFRSSCGIICFVLKRRSQVVICL